VGCAATPENNSFVRRKATVNETRVTVTWAKNNADATRICEYKGLSHRANGCAFGDVGNCHIVAIQPDNFLDKQALEVMGHELWHCLGAKHD
jgi:hypothetical protein